MNPLTSNDGFLAPPSIAIPSSPTPSFTSSIGSPSSQSASNQSFTHKLYKMVSDTSTDNIIRWTERGDSFIVYDTIECEKILPRYYKHRQFSSFVRQLNMYGFHKINKVPRTSGHASDDSTRKDFEFSNPNFQRGRPDLLDDIKRKQSDTKPCSSNNTPSMFNCPSSPHFGFENDSVDPIIAMDLSSDQNLFHQSNLFHNPPASAFAAFHNTNHQPAGSSYSSPRHQHHTTFTNTLSANSSISPKPQMQNPLQNHQQHDSFPNSNPAFPDSHANCQALFSQLNYQMHVLADQLQEQRRISQYHQSALAYISQWFQKQGVSLNHNSPTAPHSPVPPRPSLQVTGPTGELIIDHGALGPPSGGGSIASLSPMAGSPARTPIPSRSVSPSQVQFMDSLSHSLTSNSSTNVLAVPCINTQQALMSPSLMSGMAGLDVSPMLSVSPMLNVSPLSQNGHDHESRPSFSPLNLNRTVGKSALSVDTSTPCAMQFQQPMMFQPVHGNLFQVDQQLLHSNPSITGPVSVSNAFDAYIQKQALFPANVNSNSLGL